MSSKKKGEVPGNQVRKKVQILKRKRKDTFHNADFLNKCQIPLSNKFEALSEDDNDDMEGMNKDKNNKGKISPIVVTTPNIDIQNIANTLKVKCDIKIMSIGRKVFVESLEDKMQLKSAFESKKIDFFTYPDEANKIFKIILSGLPAIDISLITNELKAKHELTPTKVVMFNTKATSKLYLCEFNKSDVNNKKLNSIHAIHSHIIKWQPYKPKRKGPTLCQRCLMYGHGISSCNRFTVCGLCAGSHLTNTCTVINEKTKNPVYKCFNCASNDLPHNHKASDECCLFRAKYIATMSSVRDKSKRGAKTNTKNNNSHGTEHLVDAPAPPPLTSSFAHTVTARSNTQSKLITNTTSTRNTHSKLSASANVFAPSSSYSSSTFVPNTEQYAQSNTNASNLWTFAQVTQLLLSSINELKQCRTKMDQITVIANLLQHACD